MRWGVVVPIVASEAGTSPTKKHRSEKMFDGDYSVDHISRHPIRSTILLLAAIAAALATIALVLVASGKPAVAQDTTLTSEASAPPAAAASPSASEDPASSLINGNFETGDLTGWSVDTTASGGTASAVANYEYCPPTWEGCGPEGGLGNTYTTLPHEGSYFALLSPGGNMSEATRISQPLTASNGDKVSGWAFFKSENYGPPGEKGQVVITSASGTTVGTPFEQLASVSSGGYYGNWKYWEYTFSGLTGTGQFQIEARVQNDPTASYACWCSYLGLDDVKMFANGPDTTKPTTSLTRSVEPNAAGWNKENVTVKLNATDNQGGWGVEKITYSASGAQTIAQTDASGDSVEVALNQEGTTTLTYYATDKAGNVEGQKTLTVKIDKTAPWVKSTSPANNATGVSASEKISVTFLESGAGIDPSTLTTNNFAVWWQETSSTSLEQISGTISYDEISKTVTFTPTSNLANGSYWAYIRGEGGRLGNYRDFGVWDKADNTLSTVNDQGYAIFEYTWKFTTTGTQPASSCTKTGTANSETISGTSGDDVICAGDGNDTVKGLGGNDTLKGEAGADQLLGGVGNDTLDGGLGTDTASYSASLTAVNASLATNSATGEGPDTFLGVENLLGSSKADTLTGSTTNNTLTGGGGTDTEQGGLGNDQVIGSGGADTLKGEDGDDTVNSQDGVNGNDSLDGGAGTDTKVMDATEKSIVGFP